MTARALVLGLDGADLEVVLSLGSEQLPHLHALMDRGVFAHLESVQPPATLPNWTTFLTGVDPGRHGVFDFTLREGYGVRFTAGSVREAPTWLARLDQLGLCCACVGFPATYPPERLQHGIFISGWDAPVAFEADRSFVWPPSLHGSLTKRFGPLRFDEQDQFAADRPGWHSGLGAALETRVRARTELASFLLARQRWDAFAFYFGESDTAAHYLWSLHDPGSPRRPERVDSQQADGLARVYRALDAAVGRLVQEAGEDAEISIVSDHGSGGSSDRVLYLNRALEQLGLLSFKRNLSGQTALAGLKRAALHGLSPRLRERLFRVGRAALPSWLESQVRFGAIDMPRTQAFSDELNYFPAVHFNVRGREPQGIVSPADLPALRARVRESLLGLRDPWRGRPVVQAVHEREAVFEGPYVSRAPDLLLELRSIRGYTYNLMPSSKAPPGASAFDQLSPEQWLGRKGRSLPGSHRPRGLWVAAGPRVAARGQVEARMADAAAAVLVRLGIRVPEEFGGSAPAGVATGGEEALPWLEAVASRQSGDPSRVEARLRALGYID